MTVDSRQRLGIPPGPHCRNWRVDRSTVDRSRFVFFRLSTVDCRLSTSYFHLAVAIALAATVPVAEAETAQVVTAIVEKRASVTELVLVGESGQLYQPRDDGWSRDHAGGIAGDVAGAVKGKDGTVYVVGGRAPVYEHIDGSWRVRSIGVRRRSRANTLSGLPIVAAGRNLFSLDGDRWRRIGTTRGRVELIWASSRSKIYVADDTGEITRGDGRRWTTIANAFTGPEQVERFIGSPGKALYAVGDAGTIVSVGASKATPVTIPADLAELKITAGGIDGKGVVYVAGDLGDKHVLATLANNKLELAEELPDLDAGDRYSLIIGDKHGSLLVASYAGAVQIRDKDGTWTKRAVSLDLPAEKPVKVREHRRPARTR